MKRILLNLTLSSLMLSSSANSTTIYTTEDSFMNALATPYYLENFQDVDSGHQPLHMFMAATPPNYIFTVESASMYGIYFTDDSVSSTDPRYPLLIQFEGAYITAFGGYFYAPHDPSAQFTNLGTIHITLSDGTSHESSVSTLPVFIGFTTNNVSFDRCEIWSTSDNPISPVYAAINKLYVGSKQATVPEPASAILFGIGLLGLAGIGRRHA
jgi:hypothetical protein